MRKYHRVVVMMMSWCRFGKRERVKSELTPGAHGRQPLSRPRGVPSSLSLTRWEGNKLLLLQRECGRAIWCDMGMCLTPEFPGTNDDGSPSQSPECSRPSAITNTSHSKHLHALTDGKRYIADRDRCSFNVQSQLRDIVQAVLHHAEDDTRLTPRSLTMRFSTEGRSLRYR